MYFESIATPSHQSLRPYKQQRHQRQDIAFLTSRSVFQFHSNQIKVQLLYWMPEEAAAAAAKRELRKETQQRQSKQQGLSVSVSRYLYLHFIDSHIESSRCLLLRQRPILNRLY